jgi:hypothetical protein
MKQNGKVERYKNPFKIYKKKILCPKKAFFSAKFIDCGLKQSEED